MKTTHVLNEKDQKIMQDNEAELAALVNERTVFLSLILKQNDLEPGKWNFDLNTMTMTKGE